MTFSFLKLLETFSSEIQIIYTLKGRTCDAGALTYFNGKVIICTNVLRSS